MSQNIRYNTDFYSWLTGGHWTLKILKAKKNISLHKSAKQGSGRAILFQIGLLPLTCMLTFNYD